MTKPKAASATLDNEQKTKKPIPPQLKPFQPGNTFGKGRPKGSRNKLGEAFIADLLASWEEGGADVIKKVMAEEPGTYLKVVAGILPKQVEIKDDLAELTDEQLAALSSALSLLAAGYQSASSEDIERSKTAPRH